MTLNEIAARHSAKLLKDLPAYYAAVRQQWINLVKNKTPYPMSNQTSGVEGSSGPSCGCVGHPGDIGPPGPSVLVPAHEWISPNAMIPPLSKVDFVAVFKTAQAEAHDCARSKGFWDERRNFGEAIALVHSELSEAMEGYRHKNPPDDKIPEFTSIEAELADAVIRILDLAESQRYRLAEAIVAKMAFNRSRPYKHGKTC